MPDLFVRRATLAPQTADAEARTVEAVWTTGAAVRRRDAAGAYLERLSLDPSAVDLSRLIGASVLDAHRQSAVRDVLGTVRDARVDGRQGVATLQFSARPEVDPIWQDVMAGILRHVSVGYTVERWRDDADPATGERIRTAVAWTPIEISLVPTPADPGATIRQGGTMPEIDTAPADAPESPPVDQIETRAAINAEIRSIARIAGLGTEFADGLIDNGATADEARRAAFEALAARGGDTIGRTLPAAYQAAPAGVRRLGRQTTARDFRTVNKIMFGEAPMLEKLDEHGEIRAGTMAEAKEAYKVETFARKIGVTRQVLVNDDLGAFADLARRLGQAAAETEARLLVDLLEGPSGNGPTMNDGKALFHADHGNKAASGGAIADDTLSAARLAMRSQTGLSGQPISASPKYLLVPPAQETVAEKWLATIAAAKAADVNPFSGSLSLVVEPRLSSATRWYVSADPAEIDGLEYAYLAGGEGPQVENKAGWDVDGVEIRVILDFGAGFIDWRGWYANEGA